VTEKPPINVVTAFLTRDNQVLVLKRSDQVGTYQNLWAGISGYLETDDPQIQALKEIGEEIGISDEEVVLETIGEPLIIADGDRVWRVHPFRYALSDNAVLMLDWEHVETKFVDPYELGALETVPGLMDAWLRVEDSQERETNSAVAPEFETLIGEIATDREHGAAKLASRGLDALEILANSGSLSADPASAMTEAAKAARRLHGLRPGMGSIGVQAVLAVTRARGLMEDGMSPSVALARAAALERQTLGQSTAAISNMLTHKFGTGGSYVTCSWSMTAMRALLALNADAIYIGDGHDMEDGLRAATWLAARGRNVEVVPDGSVSTKVASARAVIVGADQILADGSLVNRASSFSLALAASYFEVPFYVVCQRIKLSGNNPPIGEEAPLRPRTPIEGVNYHSPLFDVTPAHLLSGIITESGILTPGEAAEIGASMDRLRTNLFENY